jgi:alpha-tubulin suppressor-like RCC1 family protein
MDNLALQKDGTVLCRGDSPAIQNRIFSNAVAIAAGAHHSLGLKRDGILAVWGADGVLAAALRTNLIDVIAIATEGDGFFDHDLALKRDGTVPIWGSRGPAQSDKPRNLINAIAIAAGGAHGLALRWNGNVVSWAFNYPQVLLPKRKPK